MKKIIVLLFLLISTVCFAQTYQFEGEQQGIPAVLQGSWTETSVSPDKGKTWIKYPDRKIILSADTFLTSTKERILITDTSKFKSDKETIYVLMTDIEGFKFQIYFQEGRVIILYMDHDEVFLAAYLKRG